MLVVQDQVWGRVTENRAAGKSTRYYIDEMHLLLKEEQTAAYTVEIWKRFRKWGGIPTGLTQNVKDLLASKEVENIFENSDFVYMLNQAAGDRQILAKTLSISPYQLSYVTHSGAGEGLIFYGDVILPFVDKFPTDIELYRIMTTRLSEIHEKSKNTNDNILIVTHGGVINIIYHLVNGIEWNNQSHIYKVANCSVHVLDMDTMKFEVENKIDFLLSAVN